MSRSSVHDMVSKLTADAEYSRSKLDEVAERLSSVEIELVGKVGDRSKPSIRDELREIKDFVGKARARDAARTRWLAGLASGGLLAGLAALLRGWPPSHS